MARTLFTLALIACLLTVAMGPAFASSSSPEYTQLDADHPLDTPEAISNYEETGSATAELSYPRMSMTVADNRKAVDLSNSFLPEFGATYFRIDYEEDKERVVRVYLPREYQRPYSGEVEAVVGDANAEVEPVRNRDYISVKVHLSGDQDEYVFKFSGLDGISEDVRAGWVDRLDPRAGDEEVTPEAEEWQYVSSEDIGDSYAVEVSDVESKDYRVQYHSDGEWLTVPPSETSDDPYYLHVRDGVDDKVFVIPTSEETPQLRYKTDKSLTETAEDVSSGVKGIIDSLREDLFGLFG